MTGERTKSPELRALTGLRFLAAFHVLVFHALFTFSRASVLLPLGPLRSLLGSGYVEVNFFFVLSGFVLAYAYVRPGDATATATMTTTAGRFWRERFERIYPLHLAGLLVALPLFALGSRANHATTAAIVTEGAKELALSALLLQAWVPAHVLDLNGPSWSLSVEAFFYALFPALVKLCGRLRARGLVLVGAGSWLAALAPPLLHRGPASVLARMTDLDLVLLHDPLVRLPDFVVGVVTGLLFLRAEREDRRWPRAPLFAVATFLLILSLLATSDRLPFALLHNGLLDPLWALLLFALAAAGRSAPSGADARGLGSAPLVRGGHASYALYVLHKPAYFWAARIFDVGVLPPSPFVAAYLGGSVALALVARRYVEEPLRRLFARRA